MASKELNGASSPINWAKKTPGPLIVVMIRYILKSNHFWSDWLEATAFSINAIPRTPSSTVGKSSIAAVGVPPANFVLKVSTKFL
ncbi:hypothetical protein D3C87_1523940 [compost metagenome]